VKLVKHEPGWTYPGGLASDVDRLERLETARRQGRHYSVLSL